MISLLSRYPELAPFIPDDVETPKYLDMLAARLLQQALGGGGIGLQALSIILDRHDGKLTDKLEVSGGLDSTLTVQSFREQMLSIAARTTVETVVPVDDLDTTF
jgi:hypothetical protein